MSEIQHCDGVAGPKLAPVMAGFASRETGLNLILKCLLFGSLVAGTAAAASPQVPPVLPPEALALLQARNIKAESLGAAVIHLKTGRVVWSHQADLPMQPASTMKTLTSIVALETLGPDFRARAQWLSAAPLVDGVLQGDLVLRGLGHPEFTWDDVARTMQTLRDKGIKRIAGDIVVDRTYFLPARMDLGVPPFDETPEFRYNVIPDALTINTNLVQYNITSTDSRIDIEARPPLPGVTLISNMTFSERDRTCDKWEDDWKLPTVVAAGAELRVYLQGRFPRNCSAMPLLNLIDRAELNARVLPAMWRAAGGELAGRVVEQAQAAVRASVAAEKVFAEHRARPLAEVIRTVNKISDNPVTRIVYLNLGVGEGADKVSATREVAEARVRAWLKSRDIDDKGLVLDNGSGLSRSERITPLQLARVIESGSRSKWAPEFLASLPIVGVDGSMRARLKGSKAAETARIKTGSLRNVVAVAGTVTDQAGEKYAVGIMINDDRAIQSGGRQVLDQMLELLASRTQAAAN